MSEPVLDPLWERAVADVTAMGVARFDFPADDAREDTLNALPTAQVIFGENNATSCGEPPNRCICRHLCILDVLAVNASPESASHAEISATAEALGEELAAYLFERN